MDRIIYSNLAKLIKKCCENKGRFVQKLVKEDNKQVFKFYFFKKRK